MPFYVFLRTNSKCFGEASNKMDIACLEEAVVAFYRSTSQEQAHLHEWLTNCQTSKLAWVFSWQLMQIGKVG